LLRNTDLEEENMGNCPYCKQKVSINDVKTETRGVGSKREIMYMCPHCESILGFSRSRYLV